VRQQLGRWRTWNPAFVWALAVWFGGALAWTGLALFDGPHHQAFYLVLVVLWAGAVVLAGQMVVSFGRQRRRELTGSHRE
jgi:4-amino-4-deoxy-L-arabinose transferase-like glycosyltransferase